MTYRDILEQQAAKRPNNLKWWPSFFYHFTDVHNAISIIKSGWIMSREQAVQRGVMAHDNASHAVIEATDVSSSGYGRLYFRPLTPTQYHNEGYKPEAVRDKEINASCPVPVFFCLSSVATLSYPGTKFASKGLAGHRHNIQEGEEAFSELKFDKIYHDGWYDTAMDNDIKEYRQSEVLRENGFPLEPLLRCILCRSEAEKETLLFLIKSYSMRMYNSYKERIFYKPQLKCFYNNGIFLKKVWVNNDKILFELNEPQQRKSNRDKKIEFKVDINLEYIKESGEVIAAETRSRILDYLKVKTMMTPLNVDSSFDSVRCKVTFDGEEMYENELDIKGNILL